ncbi:hypothetical protein EXIGLDRAFT_837775 [Exidia glandulosa HHB12029]|uniref:Protein kinase domain-containing protein n=1 Tax=Exidia glandulosa HHB12029 TaxID=1314781 RepID=A0A166AC48_EXIGL|nr:hypothetical protein EXIGLDRAFT_841287 [Exidia glandulosa HHB12029]KZV90529.1 hypothetical protein EXIGLDRAFT_837775 [Exidia glandulosa HHB12029]
MSELPKSFREIRDAPTPHEIHPRTLWKPFESFFASHNLTLWEAGSEPGLMIPPDDRPRAPDGFLYRFPMPDGPFWGDDEDGFMHTVAMMCPARTADCRDVLIRIVSMGDEGLNHRTALERLSTGNVASVIGNHAVPVLQWLTLEHITFAVLPLLSQVDPVRYYCYEDVDDVLKTMIQMLEGVAFIHSKNVAHLDLWVGNFLCNYAEDFGPVTFSSQDRAVPVPPFRSTFPFNLYIIDFENCACFDLDSDSATHRISGLPPGLVDSRYNRPRYPEMKSDEPYDPFFVDVWQLGRRFHNLIFGTSEDPDEEPDESLRAIPPAVVALVERMTSEDPAHRPSAAAALAELKNIASKLSKAELKAAV